MTIDEVFRLHSVNYAAALKKIAAVVGKDNVRTKPVDLLSYSYTPLMIGDMPVAVIFPASAAETAAVMKILHEYNVAVIPRGSGTNLCGGTVVAGQAVILELSKLDKIFTIDIMNRYIEVGAGVLNMVVQKALAPYGYFFGPDPASMEYSTVGGNIVENSGGMRCLKYGVTADNVIGVEVVLADGRTVISHGPVGDTDGYDLTGLMHGSEGAFGIVTKAWLRIVKIPEAVKGILTIFNDVAAAARTVSQIISRGIIPKTLELIDEPVLTVVEEIKRVGYPAGAKAVLLIEVDGAADSMGEQVEKILSVCRENGVAETRVAKDEAERQFFWTGRLTGIACLQTRKPSVAQEDITVPRTKLPEMMMLIQEIARRRSLLIGHVCHMGDGNFHPTIMYDKNNAEETAQVHHAFGEIMSEAIKMGGTISGEHGVGIEKLAGMEILFSPHELAYMNRLKRAFDEMNLLNPGKAVPPLQTPAAEADCLPVAEPTGQADFLPELSRCCPELAVCTDEQSLCQYAAAGGSLWFAARPERAEQVASVVRYAKQYRLKILPWGRGTHSADSVRGQFFDGVIDVSGLKRIVEIDKANLTVTVEAGAQLADVQAAVQAQGLLLPLDSIGSASPSVGGMVAANVMGSLQAKYKAVKNIVSGVRFVNDQGEMIRYGGKNIKDVAGFDLNKLMIGSRGTLGIITEITLKLYPLPEQALCRTYRTTDRHQFMALLTAVQQEDIDPLSFDIFIHAETYWARLCVGGIKQAVRRQASLLDEIELRTLGHAQQQHDPFVSGHKEFAAHCLPQGVTPPNSLTLQSFILFTDVADWIIAVQSVDKDAAIFGHAGTGQLYGLFPVCEQERAAALGNKLQAAIAEFQQSYSYGAHTLLSNSAFVAAALQFVSHVDQRIKTILDSQDVFPGLSR